MEHVAPIIHVFSTPNYLTNYFIHSSNDRCYKTVMSCLTEKNCQLPQILDGQIALIPECLFFVHQKPHTTVCWSLRCLSAVLMVSMVKADINIPVILRQAWSSFSICSCGQLDFHSPFLVYLMLHITPLIISASVPFPLYSLKYARGYISKPPTRLRFCAVHF